METRLSRILKAFQNRWATSVVFSMPWGRNRFAHRIAFLFFGFLFGNLFGTFLPFIRLIFPWDGLIVLIIIFFMELLSFSRYQRSRREFLGMWKVPPVQPRRPFYDTSEKDAMQEGAVDPKRPFLDTNPLGWNAFKIGFLLGFFIDAYKVGS